MKISVLTLHRVFNYGSALQAYATQKIMEKYGAECEIVDYITEQRTWKRIFFYVPEGMEVLSIKGVLYVLTRFPNNVIKYLVFGKFRKNRLNLTKRKYTNIEELRSNPPQADIYMTGSDQVWNSDYNEGLDGGFFLDFGKENQKRVAYAASIGMEQICEEEKVGFVKFLSKYSGITVREKRAQELLQQLGIKDSSVVLDPTLMLRKSDWMQIEKQPKEKGYILVMILYNEDSGITEIATRLAKKVNLPIIELVWNPYKKTVWEKRYGKTPEEFLGYVHNADYVITNSFHGTAFCVNYHKQFLAVKRTMYNNRIESLLEQLGLEDRYISQDTGLNIVDNMVNYDVVEAKLERLRQESLGKINEMLGDV